MTPRTDRSHWHRGLALVVIAACAWLAVVTMSREASAQQRTFYLDRLQIGGTPLDGFAVWRPRMKERTEFYGQAALGYSLRPLRGSTATIERFESRADATVAHQINTYFSGGVQLLERLSLGVTLPVAVYQTGEDPCGTYTGACHHTDENPAAAYDTRLDARAVLYRSPGRQFHLGLAGAVWIPSGDDISFTGDDQTTGAIKLLAELDLQNVILALDTGVHFRPTRTLNQLRVGDEWTWAGGVFVPLRDGSLRLGGEVFGSTGISEINGESTFFTGRNTPVQWLGEARIALDKQKAGWAMFGAGTRLSGGYGAPDVRVLASIGYSFGLRDTSPKAPGRRYIAIPDAEGPGDIGDKDKDGIPDDLDLCPEVPEDGAEPDPRDGCPAPPDRDHDGIPDESDKCPDEPEDKDGIDDIDGCPEEDFDTDGVPDVEDACPREPGERSAEPDKNGCPQFIRRIEGSTEIQILKRVEFATNSARILPQSYPILDEVVRLLNVNPDIKKVLVEGHTDSRGGRPLNMRLSQARAESVMKYLTEHGVSAARLTAEGFGPDRPIDTNDTDEGRQRNRRVQFKIVEQEE